MTQEEIREALLKHIQARYSDAEIRHLDILLGELELELFLSQQDREALVRFYEQNPDLFQGATERTPWDLQRLPAVHLRYDAEGVYFGKTGYDQTASNVAAFYVLNVYLEDLMETLPEKMLELKKMYELN